MGEDKARLRWKGQLLIERAVELLESVGCEPRILSNDKALGEFAPVVPDHRLGRGPLAGIEAGLRACAPHNRAIFIPVDAPFITESVLLQLLHRAWLTGALATVPRSLGQEQPLCAIYDRRLLPEISSALDAGDGKVVRVVVEAALKVGGAASLDCYDLESTAAACVLGSDGAGPMHRVFMNCNTPAEFQSALSFSAPKALQ